MRIYYNTNGFPHHGLDEVVSVLSDVGYDGIALTPDVHHLNPFLSSQSDVAAFRSRLEQLELGITIESGARFLLNSRKKHFPSLLSSDGHEARADFYRRLIDLAFDLGAPLVSLWSGRKESDTPPGGDGLSLLSRRLIPVLEYASQKGIKVCLEPEPGMQVQTLEQFKSLRELLSGHDLRLTVDTGHLAVSEKAPYQERLLEVGEVLSNIHLDDAKEGVHEHLFFGDGCLDFPSIAEALSQMEYQGPLAVELSRHGHDAITTAEKALTKLRELGF